MGNKDVAPRPEPAPLPRRAPLPHNTPLPEEEEDLSEPKADPEASFPHGDDEGNEQLRREESQSDTKIHHQYG